MVATIRYEVLAEHGRARVFRESALPPAPKPKLLDQVRQRIRARHYSPRTEKAYVHWIKRYILFHGKRHPLEMGAAEVTTFLTSLAVRDRVAASTQNQALNALLFLYRDVLAAELPWLEGLVRAKRPEHLPVVLTRDEVRTLIDVMAGPPRLMALLMYGAGLRLLECCRLRVQDIDFAANQVTIRDGKGGKDRLTMLPTAVREDLARHLPRSRARHARDVARGAGWVELPWALGRKYPHAGREWGWQWVLQISVLYGVDSRDIRVRQSALAACNSPASRLVSRGAGSKCGRAIPRRAQCSPCYVVQERLS